MRLKGKNEIFNSSAIDIDNDKNAEAFAELIQCLHDRSLSLIMRDAMDDGRKAMKILNDHVQSKGKPRIVTLYTELKSDYYRQTYIASFNKQYPLERFPNSATETVGISFKPSVGQKVDFRSNPALSAGVASLTQGGWMTGKVIALESHPCRGTVVSVRAKIEVLRARAHVRKRGNAFASAELEREQTNNLVNIGTCGLHVLHNAFKDGMKATKWEIQSLLKFAFYLFQESPARREDFFNITSSRLMPLQFCGHRWLENLHAAERFILVWPSIKSYVNACREGKTSEPICKSYKALSDAMSDKLVLVKLHCSIHVMKILQPFLKKYQSNVPLVPYLASDLFDIVKRIYSLILTDEALSSLTMDGVLDPTKLNKEQFKSHSKINLGCSADEALMKLVKSKTVSERDALGIHLDFQKLCISIISKIAQKSPIAYQLARDVTCINPENVKLPNASERFHNLVKELHAKRWLSPDEVNDSLYQYKSMCSKVLENLTVETRLDQFYRALDLEGMDALKKVINMVLTMSHGNAEVERGFSVNKEVSVENMAERSIIARRLICQFIKDNGNCPAMVPLGKKMLTSCSGAYQIDSNCGHGTKINIRLH
ncbi:hypothetical protein EGW08_008679 [Elysia chlorotica]|uniref:Uncharacterized protein n=1 Tax=Elysia chlorotica TaxID=188477 RepID=A0A3S1A5X1_ELYCH|nr:hypothetical protein EGW08_008679 [Elysia chlorotica]